MSKHLLSISALAVMAMSPANAALYDITDTLNYGANGFGSSGFHDQAKGQANGNYIARPDSVVSGGTWDSVSGALSFTMNMIGGGTVEALGNLSTATSLRADSALGYDALWGLVDFTFLDVVGVDDGTYEFLFSDNWYNQEANGVDYASHISLWGDNQSFPSCADAFCMGGDFRLEIAPSAVPLPATGFLLIGALGGLVARRKLTKKKS